MTDLDTTMPEGSWAFDASVAGVFDNMLARSIPQHDVMRAAVADIACRALPEGGTVLDLGCSRGGAIAAIVERRPDGRYTRLEISEPMLDAARERFSGLQNVTVAPHDLRAGIPDGEPVDVILAVLTLQFTPIEYRHKILRSIHGRLKPGGTLILVEKVIGATAGLDSLMIDLYYDMKRANGYSDEAIERKRLSLEGVLVPLTARWNVDAVHEAGFSEVDCFWRWMNFGGWVALR